MRDWIDRWMTLLHMHRSNVQMPVSKISLTCALGNASEGEKCE